MMKVIFVVFCGLAIFSCKTKSKESSSDNLQASSNAGAFSDSPLLNLVFDKIDVNSIDLSSLVTVDTVLVYNDSYPKVTVNTTGVVPDQIYYQASNEDANFSSPIEGIFGLKSFIIPIEAKGTWYLRFKACIHSDRSSTNAEACSNSWSASQIFNSPKDAGDVSIDAVMAFVDAYRLYRDLGSLAYDDAIAAQAQLQSCSNTSLSSSGLAPLTISRNLGPDGLAYAFWNGTSPRSLEAGFGLVDVTLTSSNTNLILKKLTRLEDVLRTSMSQKRTLGGVRNFSEVVLKDKDELLKTQRLDLKFDDTKSFIEFEDGGRKFIITPFSKAMVFRFDVQIMEGDKSVTHLRFTSKPNAEKYEVAMYNPDTKDFTPENKPVISIPKTNIYEGKQVVELSLPKTKEADTPVATSDTEQGATAKKKWERSSGNQLPKTSIVFPKAAPVVQNFDAFFNSPDFSAWDPSKEAFTIENIGVLSKQIDTIYENISSNYLAQNFEAAYMEANNRVVEPDVLKSQENSLVRKLDNAIQLLKAQKAVLVLKDIVNPNSSLSAQEYIVKLQNANSLIKEKGVSEDLLKKIKPIVDSMNTLASSKNFKEIENEMSILRDGYDTNFKSTIDSKSLSTEQLNSIKQDCVSFRSEIMKKYPAIRSYAANYGLFSKQYISKANSGLYALRMAAIQNLHPTPLEVPFEPFTGEELKGGKEIAEKAIVQDDIIVKETEDAVKNSQHDLEEAKHSKPELVSKLEEQLAAVQRELEAERTLSSLHKQEVEVYKKLAEAKAQEINATSEQLSKVNASMAVLEHDLAVIKAKEKLARTQVLISLVDQEDNLRTRKPFSDPKPTVQRLRRSVDTVVSQIKGTQEKANLSEAENVQDLLAKQEEIVNQRQNTDDQRVASLESENAKLKEQLAQQAEEQNRSSVKKQTKVHLESLKFDAGYHTQGEGKGVLQTIAGGLSWLIWGRMLLAADSGNTCQQSAVDTYNGQLDLLTKQWQQAEPKKNQALSTLSP